MGWPWWAEVLAEAALVEGLLIVATAPLVSWSAFVRERRWGFSTQRLGGFLADRGKGAALAISLFALTTLGLVAAARLLGELWPLAAAAAAALGIALLTFAAPLLIEPLFNRFAPLGDTALAESLCGLARQAGLPLAEVLVADASRRTRKPNAYVSGLGASRRLVVYDTLLEQAGEPELRLVVAHELGHRRAGHLAKGLAGAVIGVACYVAILWALLHSAALRHALGTPAGAGSPRVVPFVALLGVVLELLGSPLGAALSRRFEREADRFSLELTGDLAAFESIHSSLARAHLSDLAPPRRYYLAFFSHPTPVERILAARRLAASGAAPPPGSRVS